MVIVLFGQPGAGKTTLANELGKSFDPDTTHYIDGDQLRYIFQNKDYSKEGRLKNLQKSSDIAAYLNWTDNDIIVSVVYPYKEARDYLNSLVADVKWVYLAYEIDRGREQFHVKDFEYPSKDEALYLNTEWLTEEECIKQIQTYINE